MFADTVAVVVDSLKVAVDTVVADSVVADSVVAVGSTKEIFGVVGFGVLFVGVVAVIIYKMWRNKKIVK